MEFAHSQVKTLASSRSSTSACPGNLSVIADSRMKTHLGRTVEIDAAFSFRF